MGDVTGIGWCDHTFNPWIGCTKVSQGCKHCYAERDNGRFAWVDGWGPGHPRKRTSAANWNKPLTWARAAAEAGEVRRVFCASLSDVFDAEVDQAWRDDLWQLIQECAAVSAMGGLEWLILTKRPENIVRMFPLEWISIPPDYIRLGVTAEDQPNWDTRVKQLNEVWSGKNFVSVEPMIGAVNPKTPVDWIICGCESGPNAREMGQVWVRDLLDNCLAWGVPFFLKQMMIDGRLVKEPEFYGQKWTQFP